MKDSPKTVAARRAALRERLLPVGMPTLWCPLLTHYTAEGALDFDRMRSHLDHLQSSVTSYLVPGSTGDGWELTDQETSSLLDFLVAEAASRRLSLLVGILKPTAAEMMVAIAAVMTKLKGLVAACGDEEALLRSPVRGFAICPPRGSGLSQSEISDGLGRLLSTGLPISLYQLPQVTGNEMAPQTVRDLAAPHGNFIWFKDSSGTDRVADSGLDDVLLLRGAEGGYSRHLKEGGGKYDGLLLSSANGFGPQLDRMIRWLRAGEHAAAHDLSDRISDAVRAVFEAAAPLAYGNTFTNANKAIDHFIAHGPGARRVAPPRLHSGHRLPATLIDAAGAALTRYGLMPAQGYLAASQQRLSRKETVS